MPGHLTRESIDTGRLIASVAGPDLGGVAVFLGVVRDHQDGRTVHRLAYSAYEPMAEAESVRIVAEAEARWPARAALVHRLGEVRVGEVAVAIAAASAHRAQAFDACRYVIEEVKRRVPIWKQEFYADGTVEWVDPSANRAPAAGPGVKA